MQERLFTIHQVADLLGATPREVHEWIRREWLVSQELPDGLVRVSERSLIQFLKGRGIDIMQLMVSTAMGKPGRGNGQGKPEGPIEWRPPEGPAAEGERLALTSEAQEAATAPAEAPAPPPAVTEMEAEQDAAIREMLTGARPAPEPKEEAEAEAAEEELGEELRAGAPAEADPVPAVEDVDEQGAEVEAGGQEEGEDSREERGDRWEGGDDGGEAGDGEGVEEAVVEAIAEGVSERVDEAATEVATPLGQGLVEGEEVEEGLGEEGEADAAGQVAEAVLADAVACGASHVHLAAGPDGPSLHLRVDGALREKPQFHRRLPPGLSDKLIERYLTWAGVAEHASARPRAGRFQREIDGRAVDFSLSALPTTSGVRVVIAVQDREVPLPGIAELAMPEPARRQIESALAAPGGRLLLVAGIDGEATGAALRAMGVSLRHSGRTVLTVETAAAVRIDGASQSRIEPLEGYTFAEASRALAAQDADAILIDQVRDPVTATAAMEAALAGATVLGAVRAAGAAEALALLAEMGLEPWPLASALKAVLSARRLRRLCEACRAAADVPASLGLSQEELGPQAFGPIGCERCGGRGYAGAIVLAAVLLPGAEVVRLVRERAGIERLRAACDEAEAAALREVAAAQVRAGATSIEEVARVF